MLEVTGNLWTYPADIRVITTNGYVKRNGECVMGRGCALEAKTKWPLLPKAIGDHISKNGNVPVLLIPADNHVIMTFPVKHHWREEADRDLIERSAKLLVSNPFLDLTSALKRVVMPRPGCGNGRLRWCNCEPGWPMQCLGVKHIIEHILDDRFHVITWK